MKNTFLLALFFFNLTICDGQVDSNERAKLYFQEAKKSFNQNNFEQTLEYIEDVEEILGGTNGRVLNLKIITLYKMGQFIEAEKNLNLFINEYSNSVTQELKNETLSYLVRIERAANEAKKRLLEEERKNELARKKELNRINREKQLQAKRSEMYEKRHEILEEIAEQLSGSISFEDKWRYYKRTYDVHATPSSLVFKIHIVQVRKDNKKKYSWQNKNINEEISVSMDRMLYFDELIQMKPGTDIPAEYYDKKLYHIYFGYLDGSDVSWQKVWSKEIGRIEYTENFLPKFEKIKLLMTDLRQFPID